MKEVRRSGQFRKDLRLAERHGRDLTKLAQILDLLIAGQTLPPSKRDHALRGRRMEELPGMSYRTGLVAHLPRPRARDTARPHGDTFRPVRLSTTQRRDRTQRATSPISTRGHIRRRLRMPLDARSGSIGGLSR